MHHSALANEEPFAGRCSFWAVPWRSSPAAKPQSMEHNSCPPLSNLPQCFEASVAAGQWEHCPFVDIVKYPRRNRHATMHAHGANAFADLLHSKDSLGRRIVLRSSSSWVG